jgi:hypothetical protein
MDIALGLASPFGEGILFFALIPFLLRNGIGALES